MKLIKLPYILFIILFSFSSFAQEENHDQEDFSKALKNSNGRAHINGVYTIPVEKEETEGSPYYIDDWSEGYIVTKNPPQIVNVPKMRFNVLHNYIEAVQDDENSLVITAAVIDSFALYYLEQELPFKNYKNMVEGEKNLMAQTVYSTQNNKVQLLKHVEVTLLEATYNATLNVGDRFDKIIQDDAFYFLYEDELYKVKGKKQAIEFFQILNFDIESYIKETKMKCKTQEDLENLLKYYDERSVN